MWGEGACPYNPRTSLHGKTPRQVAAAEVCRSFQRREVRLTRDQNTMRAFVAAQTRHVT